MESFLYGLAATAIAGLFGLSIGKPKFYLKIQKGLFLTASGLLILNGLWAVAVIQTTSKLKPVIDPKMMDKALALSQELYIPLTTWFLLVFGVLVGLLILQWLADLASAP